MGLKVTGVCRGVRVLKAREEGKAPKYFLGVADNKRNGYPGEEDITEVMIPQDFVKQGWDQRAMKMVDQLVEVPIFISSRSYKDRAYVDLIMNGEVRPMVQAVPQPATGTGGK